MKELHDLCAMCERYLKECSIEKIYVKKSETWDGWQVRIEECPDYKRVQIDHSDSKE